MATNADVEQYLTTVDFPAGKDDLVREAQRQGAPDDVVRALRSMPPVDYANKGEVVASAIRVEPEHEPAPLEAAQARENDVSPRAKHLRES